MFTVCGKHQYKGNQERFTALRHHLSVGLFRGSFYALRRQASPGIDGVRFDVGLVRAQGPASRPCNRLPQVAANYGHQFFDLTIFATGGLVLKCVETNMTLD